MSRRVSWPEINEAIQRIDWPTVNLIIGIARGGIVPAILVANHLNKDVCFAQVGDSQQPIFTKPEIVQRANLIGSEQKILLVDDVSRTGKTLNKIKKTLKSNHVTTCVLVGEGDINVLGLRECVKFPWSFKEQGY